MLVALQVTISAQPEQGDGECHRYLLFSYSGVCVRMHPERSGRATLNFYRSLGGIKRCKIGQKEDGICVKTRIYKLKIILLCTRQTIGTQMNLFLCSFFASDSVCASNELLYLLKGIS